MKRGKVSALLLIAVASSFISCQSTRSAHDQKDPRASWSTDEAYKQLIQTKCFAFGGVGFAGTTSNGEFALCAVLRSPNAANLFTAVCSEATDEGKLYALCGLRATDRNAFNHYVAALREKDGSATTMSGCIIDSKRISTIIQEIANGDYDSYVAKR